MSLLKSQAIQNALIGDWASAIAINQALLQDNPEDIDTLNRLAFAYASMGNVKDAKNVYQKVLLLDSQNPIALKNIKRLNGQTIKKISDVSLQNFTSNMFIEEPGKTKVVELINVADKKITGFLRCGEMLNLSVKRMKIFVSDNQSQYIGMLPDDLSKRLIKFINGGNKYEAYIKTADNHKVVIFVREIRRSSRFKNQSSFISSKLSFNAPFVQQKLQNNSKQKAQETEEEGSYDKGDEEESL